MHAHGLGGAQQRAHIARVLNQIQQDDQRSLVARLRPVSDIFQIGVGVGAHFQRYILMGLAVGGGIKPHLVDRFNGDLQAARFVQNVLRLAEVAVAGDGEPVDFAPAGDQTFAHRVAAKE